jgi:hypothetical protein
VKSNIRVSITGYFSAISIIFILYLALFSVLGIAHAQTPSVGDLTIRGDIEAAPDEPGKVAVSAIVSVIDTQGQPIKDLSQDSITIIQDGKPIEGPLSLTPAQQPGRVILIIDRTADMVRLEEDNTRAIEMSRSAIEAFLENHLIPEDQIAMFIVDDEINEIQDFLVMDPVNEIVTINNLRTNLTYDEVESSNPCLLYEAVDEAINQAEEITEQQTAVLVFTDQETDECSADLKNAPIDRAKEHNIPLYLANFEGSTDTVRLSAGTYLTSSTSIELEDWFNNLESQLRDHYKLSYSTDVPTGEYPIIIQASEGSEPARAEGRVFIEQPNLAPTPTIPPPTPTITPQPPTPVATEPPLEVPDTSNSSWTDDFIPLFASLVGIVVFGVIAFTFIRNGLRGAGATQNTNQLDPVMKTMVRRKKSGISTLLNAETTLATQLVILEGPEELKSNSSFVITHAETTIGRLPKPEKDNYLALYDQTVSREHAEILFDHNNREQGYMIRDISSEGNYVMINGVSIQKYRPITLRPGDIIEIGDVVLQFEALAPGSINPQPPPYDRAKRNYEEQTKELE